MAASSPILIAGGGIGGLAAALALARRNRPSIVLERQPEIAAAGAGIQIGPNGMRAIQALGVANALEPFAGKPGFIVVHAGASGRVLARLPLGDWLLRRHGAPYWVVHRGDLHRVLLDAAKSVGLISVRTGFDVQAVHQDNDELRVLARSGATEAGCALIGADGLWSRVRETLDDMPVPAFAGATATRTVIAAERAGRLAIPAVGLWLSPYAHVVHYPVRGGEEIALVVIAREDWQDRGWDTQADRATLLAQLAPFHGSLSEVLSEVTSWRKWALYSLPRLPAWTSGRVALLGDAAHPMLPYLAQGGALAMEDALVLARHVDANRDVAQALTAYAEARRARAGHVQAASRRQGGIYRLGPPLSLARDAVLRLVPPAMLMRRLDWLYDWKSPE